MTRQLIQSMKRVVCICAALAGFVLSVQAQANTLSVASGSIAQGGVVALPIELENASVVSGAQFTVTLPEGVSIKEVAMNEERSNGHTIEYQWNETKRSALILVYAQPTAAFKGNAGALCTLTLSAASDAVAGSYPVALGDVRLAADATTQVKAVTVDGTLTISSRYEISVGATEGGTAIGGGIVDAGATVTLTATPSEGYHFVRWSDGSTANPYTFEAKANVSLTAEFAPNVYRIVYMVDGVEYQVENVSYGSKVTAIAPPTKEGHTFSGWSGLPATMPAKDVTVNGSFTVNFYTVTYMVDGEVYKTESYAYGAVIIATEAPTKEGHTFSGWSEAPATMPAGNVIVTGSFAVNSYTVTFVLEGVVLAEYTLQYGSAIEVPEALLKEGLTFSGWGKVPDTMPAQDLVFEGSYMNNPYTIIYIVDGVEYHRALVEYGSAITLIAAPTKEGYTFSGWSEVPETMPAGDITVTGSFTVNNYTITYMVDGEVYKTESLAYGSAVTAIAAPAKEGHTFSGWSGVPATMPANDVTISGHFVTDAYTVTYMVDGEVYKTFQVAYGTEIPTVEVPSKEGHTFRGWSEIPGTMPAEDVIISGAFTINKYLVTFTIDGVVIASDSLEYGTPIVPPAMPEREGYTFSGWGDVAETVPACDVVYNASYTANIYKVYYFVGATLVHIAEVAYGEAIPEYVYEPTEEGYSFLGWIGETYETMPAHDVTYVANIDNGIGQLTSDKSQLTIYDLAGRKVTDTERLKGGIYIVNGKKVVIK